MYGQRKLVDGIRSFSPTKEKWTAKTVEELPEKVTVRFETGQTGVLDMKYPRAVTWARMIDYLQKNNRPVYVEIDPDTNIVTKLYVPEAARVWQIKSQDEEVVYVALHTSSARHYLRRNHPDFQKMLNALQAAMDTDSVILVTSTHRDFEIIDVRELPSSFGTDEPPGPPAPPAPDPPVTWDRAVELFNMMKAQSCVPCSSVDPCIPFKYPYDGCWIRAHLMCYLMMDEGETPEKMWIDSAGCNLFVPTSNVPECQITWCWHVAPTLMVSQTSGPDIKMVIDPSLCDKPVTPEEWRLIQTDTSATLTPSSWDKYGHWGGTATQSQANNDMESYRILLDGLCSDYGPPPYVCPIVKSCHFITDRSTFSDSEIAAMLQASSPNPAEIEAAFYVVVDGFSPEEDLNVTSATLTGVPNIKPTLAINPQIAQMAAEPVALNVEDPLHLKRRQRLTWTYKITFTGTNGFGFAGDVETVTLSASISSVSSNATIYLIKQPNPYEIDGETSWLSTDLRVFQIEAGASKFGVPMGSNPSTFITQVVTKLKTGNTGGQTFESDISTNQQTSWLELSQTVGGTPVYNFAIAKVRYRALTLSATDVRVFFRLFPVATTSLEYDQGTTYRRHESGGTVVPLLGIKNNQTVAIPCFASPRVDSAVASMTTQTDTPNVQTIPPNSSGAEVVRYYGCWLDINQTQPQFPLQPSPADGPYASGRKSIQDLIRNEHQCLVSEIAFTPAPAQNGSTPSVSDKLAQRNLAIVESANPGLAFSRRIPQTFEIRPSSSKLDHDELMIDWGNVPVGSVATLYLPGIDTNDILLLAARKYRSHRMVRIDEHTVKFDTGGITYLPIPFMDGNFPGMLTVDLPEGIEKGQAFTTVVRQVTGEQRQSAMPHRVKAHQPGSRHIVGSFQLTIPVREKADILPRQQRLLSNLRWIERAIPATDRWSPVFGKYVTQIAHRVDALGGDSSSVAPSASGQWQEAYRNCLMLTLATVLLIAMLVVDIGALSGGLIAITGIPVLALLIGAVRLWTKKCRPKMCQLLRALLAGAGAGAIILALLAVFAIRTPQLITTLIVSAGIAALTAIVSWKRGCFE